MSHLSDIGFDIDSEVEFYKLAKKAYAKASSIKTDKGMAHFIHGPTQLNQAILKVGLIHLFLMFQTINHWEL